MRLMSFAATLCSGLLLFTSALAGELAGVPMKDYHFKAFGNTLKCSMCHQTDVPRSRPSDQACRTCHGTMDKIQTPANDFDKKPHQSAHYADTLECTACHAEHKANKDLCSTCHNIKWKKFQ